MHTGSTSDSSPSEPAPDQEKATAARAQPLLATSKRKAAPKVVPTATGSSPKFRQPGSSPRPPAPAASAPPFPAPPVSALPVSALPVFAAADPVVSPTLELQKALSGFLERLERVKHGLFPAPSRPPVPAGPVTIEARVRRHPPHDPVNL